MRKRFTKSQTILLLSVLLGPYLLIFAGGVIGLLAGWLENVGVVFAKVGIWLQIFAIGLTLYWLRENRRLAYGALEVVFGLFLVAKESIFAFIDTVGVRLASNIDLFTQSELPEPASPLVLLQVVAGFYVLVRDLDNIGQGLKGTKREKRWTWFSLRKLENRDERIKAMLPWTRKPVTPVSMTADEWALS
jgi:hypothetical protein